MALFFPHLPFPLEFPCIPLVSVELDGGLADRDEVEVPPSQDDQGYGHSQTDKPLETE